MRFRLLHFPNASEHHLPLPLAIPAVQPVGTGDSSAKDLPDLDSRSAGVDSADHHIRRRYISSGISHRCRLPGESGALVDPGHQHGGLRMADIGGIKHLPSDIGLAHDIRIINGDLQSRMSQGE